jgi:hypothetical protein
MKTRIFSTRLVLSLLIIGSIGNAFASGGAAIRVKVPFDFVVGEKTLPAGEYTIRENSASGPGANLLINSSQNNVAVITATQPFDLKGGKNRAKLEFTHADGKFFLSRVFIPESEFGRQIRVRYSEDRLAKAEAETVTIHN